MNSKSTVATLKLTKKNLILLWLILLFKIFFLKFHCFKQIAIKKIFIFKKIHKNNKGHFLNFKFVIKF